MGRRRELDWQTGPGRSELGPRRPPVPAYGDMHWDDWGYDEDEGSAGVREPRYPKPLGPMSGAGEKPMPEPMTYVVLSS